MSLFFLSGMPRSGSTLLWSLLSQNPANHLSPKNNGLIETVVRESNDWTTREGFKAAGIAAMAPRMRGFLRGMFPAFYPELAKGKAVFDDSRGWLAQIPLLEEILERRVQIIVTVRDVKGVCASWENLFRKNQLTRPQRSDEQRINGATSLQRCQQYMQAGATTGMWCNWLKDAFETDLSDRLIIVPNAKLVANPIGVVALIHQALGLPEFICDPDNVEGDPVDADLQTYGLPVHSLRRSVDASALGRGNELPQDAQQWLDDNFPSINNLAAGPIIAFGQPFEEKEESANAAEAA